MLDKVSDNDRFPRTLQQLKKLIAQGGSNSLLSWNEW